jgi:hypothetical protein
VTNSRCGLYTSTMRPTSSRQILVALVLACAPAIAAENVVPHQPDSEADDPKATCIAAAEQMNRNVIERVERETNAPFSWNGIRLSGKLRDVRPKYPRLDKNKPGPAEWTAELLIDPKGQVHKHWLSYKSADGSQWPDFEKAVGDALNGWTYAPTLIQGVPSAVCRTVSEQVPARR